MKNDGAGGLLLAPHESWLHPDTASRWAGTGWPRMLLAAMAVLGLPVVLASEPRAEEASLETVRIFAGQFPGW